MTTVAAAPAAAGEEKEVEFGELKLEKGGGGTRRRADQMTTRNYMYRESNWEIGRAAEKAKIAVPIFKPGDRFKAWRLRNARKLRAREMKQMTQKKKAKHIGRKSKYTRGWTRNS